MAPIKEGDSIPSVDLFEGNPDTKVNLAEVCKEGKYVIFGVLTRCLYSWVSGQFHGQFS